MPTSLTAAQIIVLATPVFVGAMLLEWVVGAVRGRNTYRLNDAISSIGCGLLNQTSNVLVRVLGVGVYAVAYEHLAIAELPASAWWVWAIALLAYDFLYYWAHRFGHTVALFWAAHVVHHQSNRYNLSTALRQTSSGWLFGWVFYLPMAVAGVPPAVFATVALIDLLYQFWVHTEHVGRLGWFDRWFCSPSNHRVHHAVNDKYLDKNFGGILIVWDRLFGTFAEEDPAEPCVYGTRKPLKSWSPLWANLDTYAELARASTATSRWADKLRVWFKPPGWQPPDSSRIDAFKLEAIQPFESPTAPRAQGFAVLLFLLTMASALIVLWNAHRMTVEQLSGATLMVVGALWVIDKLLATPPEGNHAPQLQPSKES